MVPNTLSMKVPGWGYIVVKAENFDKLIAKYLPNSPSKLKDRIKRAVKKHGPDMTQEPITNLHTVTECLMVLATYEGLAE